MRSFAEEIVSALLGSVIVVLLYLFVLSMFGLVFGWRWP